MRERLKGELFGGMGAGLVNLLQSIPLGIIAFSSLGPEFANMGIMACIIGSVLAGLFASVFGGSPGQITAPSAALCLAFSSTLAFNHIQNDALTTISLTFYTIFLSGVMQVLLGMINADFLIKFISYPVIAAIATGSGFLITGTVLYNLLNPFHFGPLILALLTTFLLRFRTKIIKGSLGFPLAIVFATGIYYILLSFGFTHLGGTFGTFHFILPAKDHFMPALNALTQANFFETLILLTPLALNIAILSSLLSLLSLLNLKTYTEKNPDSQKELIGQGIGNIVSGWFGGLPSAGTFSRSILNIQEGGSSFYSGIFCSLTTLLFAFLFSSYIEYLPNAVIAGLTIALGLNAIDSWVLKLFYGVFTSKISLSREIIANLLLVLIVIGIIISGHIIAAIGIGVLISVLLFLTKMRSVLIKRIYENQSIPTKKIDDEKLMEFLTERLHHFKIIELDGIIYFGSAEKLSNVIETLSNEGAVYIVLDMKKVEEIDLTGARLLEMTYSQLRKHGKFLGFSYLDKRSPIWSFLKNINFFELIEEKYIFPDNDRALEYFESLLLIDFPERKIRKELNLKDLNVFSEIPENDLNILKDSLKKETYEKGEIVFKEGDVADSMFFIVEGSVDILISLGEKRTKRVQSISAGSFFGEIALLQQAPRTATVVASSHLVCYRLSQEQFHLLVSGHSQISIELLGNISRILSNRLRFLNKIISEMET